LQSLSGVLYNHSLRKVTHICIHSIRERKREREKVGDEREKNLEEKKTKSNEKAFYMKNEKKKHTCMYNNQIMSRLIIFYTQRKNT
jgi:hypothetical protein